MTINRPSGRAPDELREITITRRFTKHAAGSVLVAFGDTKVICTACVEEKVPPFMRGGGRGWVTAEYGMLPGATHSRADREATRGRQNGRSIEIQRLIGRSLRAAIDFKALGERTVRIDCDVIQADGGTRTASVTGAYVALCDAVRHVRRQKILQRSPVTDSIAAISVGRVQGKIVADLDYVEDSGAEVDLNVAMTGSGEFAELN